jgi:hypothetical protein
MYSSPTHTEIYLGLAFGYRGVRFSKIHLTFDESKYMACIFDKGRGSEASGIDAHLV